jgi:cyclopropane-fatty-acyl-phospholipid synthase
MADKQDLDFTYTTIDEIFRLSMGETGDYSGAKYDGDFSMTLEAAQKAKHKFIADSLHITKGSKVLDMACGWAPFTRYIVQERQADSLGLTLSHGQAEACRKNGFNVLVKDCRVVKPEDFGTFDAIVCIGGLEHFCSVEEWQAGKQEKIYQDFFQTLYNLLPVGSRFYMQTMTFSKNMVPFEALDVNADKDSAAYLCALMVKQFPGSWLPYGPEMVIRNAAPHFKLISQSSGRLDYIETITQWRKGFRKFNLKKYWLFLSLVPKYIMDKEFRHQVAVFKISPNRVCFEKEIMDHYRLVFEKV